jgi:N-terminal half of MaoC dehydratase
VAGTAQSAPPSTTRNWIGAPVTRVVTAESVRRFARSISPVPDSPESAVDTAPATYFCPDPVAAAQAAGFVRPSHPERSIDGGSEWEFGVPVRIGDTLTLIARVAEVVERRTRDGRELVETRLEVAAWNQRGEQAGIARGIVINYQERRT